MNGQTLIFQFLLTVFVVLCSGELRRWMEERNDRIERHPADYRFAVADGPALGHVSGELAVDVANEGGESMAAYYNESFRQIDQLCCQLLMLVETVRTSEFQGEGGMLAYGWISECASRIRMTAEERRQMLARAHLEDTLSEDPWRLDVGDWRMES